MACLRILVRCSSCDVQLCKTCNMTTDVQNMVNLNILEGSRKRLILKVGRWAK